MVDPEISKFVLSTLVPYGVMAASCYIDYKLIKGLLSFCLDNRVEKLTLREVKGEPKPNKKAILVNQDESRDDVDIMGHLFRVYGYQCQVIEPKDATKDNIVRTIEQIADSTNKGDLQTIFYFSGHGTPDRIYNKGNIGKALITNGDNPDILESRINAIALIGALGKIQGKKAIIVDSCYSGIITDYLENDLEFDRIVYDNKIIENYVAIAACPKNNVSISSDEYIKGLEIGALSYGLYRLLNFETTSVNLSTADIQVAKKIHRTQKFIDKQNKRFNNPKGGGISFEMQRVSDTNFIL